jgi:hypothetical protein
MLRETTFDAHGEYDSPLPRTRERRQHWHSRAALAPSVARHAAARSTSRRWRRAARNRSRPPRWRTECTIAPWLCGPAPAIIAYLRSSSADTWAGSRHRRVVHRHAARPDDRTAHPFRPRGHPRVSRSRPRFYASSSSKACARLRSAVSNLIAADAECRAVSGLLAHERDAGLSRILLHHRPASNDQAIQTPGLFSGHVPSSIAGEPHPDTDVHRGSPWSAGRPSSRRISARCWSSPGAVPRASPGPRRGITRSSRSPSLTRSSRSPSRSEKRPGHPRRAAGRYSRVGECVRIRRHRQCWWCDRAHALQREIAADHDPHRRGFVRARADLAA